MDHTVATCPVWCDGQHLPTWRAHSRRMTTLVNESGDLVDVDVKQYAAADPVVSLAADIAHDTIIVQLHPGTASGLAEVLNALDNAGVLGQALSEAAKLIDASDDRAAAVAGKQS